MRQTTLINGINGVGAGQTASVLLPTDRRYHTITLQYSNSGSATPAQAAIQADITEIRLVANGRPIRRFSSTDVFIVNAYRGNAFIAGVVPIFFSEPHRRTPDGEEAFALKAQNLASLALEVDIAGTAVSPALSGVISYDYFSDPDARSFVVWEKYTVPNPSAGDFDWTTLVRQGEYSAIHLFSGSITRVRSQVDSILVADRTPAQVAALSAPYGLTPQTNHFPLDFALTEQATDTLKMYRVVGQTQVPVQSFDNTITTSAGGAFNALAERVVIL